MHGQVGENCYAITVGTPIKVEGSSKKITLKSYHQVASAIAQGWIESPEGELIIGNAKYVNSGIAVLFNPKDKMIIADAHQYLLEHFEEFDFIWSSPPCSSHSRVRIATSGKNMKGRGGYCKAIYPDMKLYEEILLLQGYFKGKFCVENVVSWYKPLVAPIELNKHYFWTNFMVTPMKKESRMHEARIRILELRKGFDLSKYHGIDKSTILKNCVEPETGKHILDCAVNDITLFRI